jgi:putative membrane protein
MKRSLFVIVIGVFFVAGTAMAQEKGKEPTIDDTLAQIRAEQHVATNDKINPDKVSDKLLEQLGDAVMAERFPDKRQHQWMDNMMGGEGSASLDYMHRIMGYRFLQGYGGFGSYGFRRGGMMGGPYGGPGLGDNDPPYGYGYGMMGPGWGYGMMGGWPWIWWIVGIAVVVGLVVTVVVLATSRARRGTATTGETPLEILKKRLARGEITKEEFDKLKQDVQ